MEVKGIDVVVAIKVSVGPPVGGIRQRIVV